MPALIDTLPLGRLRAHLGRWLWLGAGLGLAALRAPAGLDAAAAAFVLGALGGYGLGALVVATLRCPGCGHRLLWSRFDDDTGLVADPLDDRACPRCGARG